MKTLKLILNAPPPMVKTLYGIGRQPGDAGGPGVVPVVQLLHRRHLGLVEEPLQQRSAAVETDHVTEPAAEHAAGSADEAVPDGLLGVDDPEGDEQHVRRNREERALGKGQDEQPPAGVWRRGQLVDPLRKSAPSSTLLFPSVAPDEGHEARVPELGHLPPVAAPARPR